MNRNKKVVAIILIILVIAAAVTVSAILVINAFSQKTAEDSETPETITGYTEAIDSNTDVPAEDDVLNIVYLGIDEEEDRSDVMMVLSINKTQNTINVVSLLRDSKVNIEGCSVGTKLGYAYKWGGEQLALKTINSNYGTTLRNYITMHFEDVENIVNAVGGVDIDLTQEEADILGGDAKAGINTLDGAESVMYSRIRNTDGGEYIRASRQQNVIKEIFRKVKSMSSQEQRSFIDVLMDNMKTNMFLDEFLILTEMNTSALQLGEYTIPDASVDIGLWSGWEDTPETAESDPPLDDRQWLWIYDLEKAGDRLKEYIGE